MKFLITESKLKQLIFKYFDGVFADYEKHGRRPITMSSPHVIFEYKNDNNQVGFEFNTEQESIRFDYKEFYRAKNIFGVDISTLVDICKEYVADKFDKPEALSSTFFTRPLK